MILVTGSLTPKQKRDAYERIQLFPNAMIIGTNALIQEKVIYQNLALVITDEQHRFGVKQRERLGIKGLSSAYPCHERNTDTAYARDHSLRGSGYFCHE